MAINTTEEKWSLFNSTRIPRPDGTDGIDLQEKYVFLGIYAFQEDDGSPPAPPSTSAAAVAIRQMPGMVNVGRMMDM